MPPGSGNNRGLYSKFDYEDGSKTLAGMRPGALIQRLLGIGTAAGLARAAGGAFVVNMLGIVLAFALQIILARSLGVASYGQYVYVLTALNFLVFVSKFGFDTATLRFVPEYHAAGNRELTLGFMRWSRIAVLTLSVTISVGIAGGIVLYQAKLTGTIWAVYLVACPLLPLNTYLLIQASTLQAFGRIVPSQSPQSILRPLLLSGFVAGTAALSGSLVSTPQAVEWMLISTVITLAVMSLLSAKYIPVGVFRGNGEYHICRWTKVAMSMLLISGFNLLITKADVLMLGALADTTEVGIYSVAAQISMFIPFGIFLVNPIIAPQISRLYSEGRLPELKKMMAAVAWGGLLFAIPVCLAIILFPQQFMALFGHGFSKGSSVLVLLSITRLLLVLSGSAGYLMSMSGNHNYAAAILGVGAATNVILNFVFIPIYQSEGAALAALLSTIIWSSAMVVYGFRRVGVNATIFSSESGKLMRSVLETIASRR